MGRLDLTFTSSMKVIALAVALFCLAEAKDLRPAHYPAMASFGTTPYIIGGSSVSIFSHPHQISLQFSSGSHTCGGSIIGNNKVACAAHCTQNSASVYRIRAGSSTRTSGGQLRYISSIRNHPSYCSSCGGFPNDVSVLTVSESFDYGLGVGAIDLATSDYTGQTCTIAGWGRTSSSNSLPTTLQGVNIGVISNSDCSNRMSPVSGATVNSGHICIYDSARRSGSCNGDSGGPMVCSGSLAGITSWGISSGGACRQDFPSVYARVSYFRSWLSSQ